MRNGRFYNVGCYQLDFTFFHRIGPLGRFDLVVAMSACCPLPVRFFCVRELVHASLVRGLVHASVALAWSPKNGELFRNGRA